MPEKTTLKRAAADKKAGKAKSTQAGEFVREEMEHVKRGKHGVKNRKQAIAIGLSKARRSGVDLAPPKPGQASEKTREQAKRDNRRGKSKSATKKSASKRGSSGSSSKSKKTASRKSASGKSTAKKSSAKTAGAKKSGAKKSGAKKSGAKRSSSKSASKKR